MLAIKSVAGPSSYVTGGFTVAFGEFEKVTKAVAFCDRSQILEADDTVYGLRVSVSGNIVTIIVRTASTVGAGPNAWSQLAATTDLSARTFTVIAEVE
jgi:hypothetical protein